MPHQPFAVLLLLLAIAGCSRMAEVGRSPDFNSPVTGNEVFAMNSALIPISAATAQSHDAASLWTAGRQSLLRDRRARQRGDILTVVIDISESATISNTTERGRSGSEQMAHQISWACLNS